MKISAAIIGSLMAIAGCAASAQAMPAHAIGGMSMDRHSESKIIQVHGRHGSCELGRYGWHRSTWFGRERCAQRRRFPMYNRFRHGGRHGGFGNLNPDFRGGYNRFDRPRDGIRSAPAPRNADRATTSTREDTSGRGSGRRSGSEGRRGDRGGRRG